MNPREAHIPLFLWIAAAVLAHLLGGGGAEQVARLAEERLDVSRFAGDVRSHVRRSLLPPVEVAIEDAALPEPEPEAEAQPDPQHEAPPLPVKDQPPKVPPKSATPAKVEREKKPEPEKPAPEAQPKPVPVTKVEPPKAEPEPPKETAKPIPAFEMPKKIAVQQHVDDPKQADNPDAEFISDKANKVKEQTQARITSTDQNDPKPTPGAAAAGSHADPGNSENNRVMQDSERAGERDRAPGGTRSEHAERAAAAAPEVAAGKAEAAAAAPGAMGRAQPADAGQAALGPSRERAEQAASKEQLAAPDVLSTDGASSVGAPRARALAPEKQAQKAEKRLPPRRPRSLVEALGLGAAGLSPGGVSLNLTPSLARQAIGADELSRLRRADGERRLSQHRGSWRVAGLERYRSAIENYVASVKPGNQTALNTAASSFAVYLNQIHNRLHPIFADGFLGSLESLPPSHPMNDPKLVTSLEIVLEHEEGRLVRRGITRTSGVTAFDISAIAAVDRAGPFGTPPSEIVSPDGNVYLHWEFHRDQSIACTTFNAHPYLLKVDPKSAPPPSAPPAPPLRSPEPTPGDAPGERHGMTTPRAGDQGPVGG